MTNQMRAVAAPQFVVVAERWPGVLTAITIALAATFVAEHQGGPQLLYALFFGMAFNFAANGEKIRGGIEFASRQILRFGVALLGARITAGQLAGLGAESIAMVAGGVLATILFGMLVGRLLGRSGTEGGKLRSAKDAIIEDFTLPADGIYTVNIKPEPLSFGTV